MIRRLDEELISVIAAGQIAVSPVFVLKELIENSLDADASTIKVDINTPFDFKVVDDGEGIKFEELPFTVERFFTSKICSREDFSRLKTYGFRGEALHSIGMFSTLKIKTRHFEEEIGGEFSLKGGKVIVYRPLPFSGGTAVSVENLYFNAPLRKKDVPRTEKRNMINLVYDYAVVNESVQFKIQDTVLFPSSKIERVKRLFMKDFKVVEGNYWTGFYRTSFEGKNYGRIKKIFVNGRPVVFKELSVLLNEIGVSEYLIFLEVPPSLLDINVSPLKDRVFLKNFQEIKMSLERKLSSSLYFLPKFEKKELRLKERNEFSYRVLRLIGSDDTVMICEDGEYYYFFDKHLLHERVNYELILDRFSSGEFELVNVSCDLRLESREKVSDLKKYGFKVEKEGSYYKIIKIPIILRIDDVKSILNGESVESVASIACKRALKSGNYSISQEDSEKLFSLYLKCKEKRFCPHGRPIFYRIKKREILRKLGRI